MEQNCGQEDFLLGLVGSLGNLGGPLGVGALGNRRFKAISRIVEAGSDNFFSPFLSKPFTGVNRKPSTG